jgi:membrane protease YdiL (CAAX protease family)
MTSPTIRTRTILAFGLLSVVLTLVVGGVWTGLLSGNLAWSPAIPWAVPVMAVLLGFLLAYLGGRFGPRRTSAARRRYLRARPVAALVFAWALAAGTLSIMSLAGLWIVLFQLAHLPPRTLPDYSRVPLPSLALLLVMASLVNALAEEASFRGYFQGALERRLSGPVAILLVAVVMAPEHASTQGFVWPTLLFYLCVDVMLGAIVYLTQSILPGVVVQALGLLVFFTLVWPGDALRHIVGTGDASAWLWLHVAQTVVFAALALLAFTRLAKVSDASRTHRAHLIPVETPAA